MTPSRENLSLRERAKDKLSFAGSLFSLPKSWLHDPAPPARYTGIPISPGYVSLRKALMAAENSEKWYTPPGTPKPIPPRRERHMTRSRHSESSILSPRPQNQSAASVQRSRLFSPRPRSALDHQSVISQPISEVRPTESPVQRPFGFRELINESTNASTEVIAAHSEVAARSGLLHELVQRFFEVWLKTPKITESFIPLLRHDQCTAQEQPPTADESLLVDGFLEHLPEIYIVDRNRRQINTSTDYKTTLDLDSDVLLCLRSELTIVG
jgi:hypothetical protein